MQRIIDAVARLGDEQSLVIGSGEAADAIVTGAGIDQRHALVRRQGSQLLVQDLDSQEGTFVNGHEVRGRVGLRPGDRLRVGSVELVVPGADDTSRLQPAEATSNAGRHTPVAASVVRAVKKVRAGTGPARAILDGVSFHLHPGEFLGILGASGSGKSTLVKAIAGLTELSEGAVLLNGEALAPQALRLDRRIAYQPQDVVIHEALTPLVALDYVARLKGLGERPEARHPLVCDALGRVGLWEHRNTPIHQLSGGQRKRAALAAELLGDPRLILLDEATSGLDPATEGEMMTLFRSLAEEGRTVACITHFPGRLHLCDRLLYLIGGKCVFFGTPDELKTFFGVSSIEDVYARQGERTPEEWEAAFRRSPVGQRVGADVPAGGTAGQRQLAAPAAQPFLRQVRDLTSRYTRLQLADFKNLLLLFAQAPVIGLMVGLTFGVTRASFVEQHAAETKQVLFVLVLAVLWCSGTASVREVVKEMPVLRHEARFGVGLAPYLLSKFVLLGLLSLAQAAVLLVTVRAGTHLTGTFLSQFLILGLTALAGVVLGLLVSSTSGTSERAMTALPVLLIAQAIFSGGLARLGGWVRSLAQLLVPAYWSLDGLKAPLSSDLLNATYPGAPGHYQPPILGSGGPLALDLLALGVQTVALLTATWIVLARQVHGTSPVRLAGNCLTWLGWVARPMQQPNQRG